MLSKRQNVKLQILREDHEYVSQFINEFLEKDRSFIKEMYIDMYNELTPNFIHQGVEHVHFGDYLRTSLDCSLIPSSVKRLNIEKCYNFDFILTPTTLHNTLVELNLFKAKEPFPPGLLPKSLTKFTIKSYDHTLVNGVLPCALKYLGMNNLKNCEPNFKFPDSIQTLSTMCSVVMDHIPQNVKNLLLKGDVCISRPLPKTLSTMEYSVFSTSYDFTNWLFNTQLTSLSLSITNCYPIDIKQGMFPESLLQLSIHQFRGNIKANGLPSSLRELDLSFHMDQKEIKSLYLPNSLKKLRLNFSFKIHFKNSLVLPDNLKDLEIESDNLDLLKGCSFPASLEKLKVPYKILPKKITMPNLLSVKYYIEPNTILKKPIFQHP
ncbi:hypothetical protein CYY_004408 [Polysphondylium violaceum]|uniref:FNIP repeat-containing protein n=1 Tax=Polysphondylium violaceum TaxID=133409 RepID=A0A8J4PVB1_9MYCE|nr:hypothetical protein CYY_004408 [Polysphondylium violaceum]